MKILYTIILLFSLVNANESEKFFWDEVKNSSDIELLKSYKKQYPHGIFEKIADIKIKRLLKNERINETEDENITPHWIKGTSKYKFYGIGKANEHFKGKHYQENLARNRAERKLLKSFENEKLSNKTIEEYNDLIEKKKYVNKKGRIYILLYIDNYNL